MITDELREFIETHLYLGATALGGWKEAAFAIADRIDAEHESKVSYWQGASYKDGYDEGFASADDYFTDKRKTLEEHGWVKLPVDADGVPIRVGDVVRYFSTAKKERVVWVAFGEGGVMHVNTNGGSYTQPDQLRHHHEPTVEDVLFDALKRFGAVEERTAEVDEWLAEYAKRLRLAGEDDA